MPIIELNTVIKAPIKRCFDLARSIDLHLESMEHTNERAVSGVTNGLINLNETVTWKARHFGIPFTMTIRITELSAPFHFTDEMVSGPFKKLKHQHVFLQKEDNTLMKDIFEFESPLGILGQLANKLFLTGYMTQLLTRRNQVILHQAENIIKE